MGAFMIEPGTGLRANDLTVWNIIFHTEKDVVIYGGRSLRQIPVLKVGRIELTEWMYWYRTLLVC